MKYFKFILVILYFESFFAVSQPVLENENLKVSVNEKGAIHFFDKKNRVQWGCELPGWVEIFNHDLKEKIALDNCEVSTAKEGENISVSFKNLKCKNVTDPEFEMQVKLSFAENHLDIEIEKFKCNYPLSSIEYPAHILSVESGNEDGYIVAPHLQGILIPSRYDAGFMRYGQNIWGMIADTEQWWTLESGNLNMPRPFSFTSLFPMRCNIVRLYVTSHRE